MEREFRVGFHMKPRAIWFISLCTALFLGGVAHAAPQYAITCSSCHGMPPLDNATGRLPDTGAFKGNHSTHLPASATVNNNGNYCLPCHNSLSYSTSHMGGQVGLQANINSSPATGKYMISAVQVTFKNQTSNPVLGTCATVNCHFETVTPQWGSVDFSTKANCQSCHSTSTDSLPHAKHFTYYSSSTGRINACTKCHPNYATATPTFQHASSAGARVIKVTLSEGAYSGGNLNYMPSQSGLRTLGTCNNNYCHSNGQGDNAQARKYRVQSWSGSLNCGSCHNNMKTFANASSGSHKVHAQTSAIACATCHNGYTETTVTTATHADRKINLGFTANGVGTVYSKYSAAGFAPSKGYYGRCSAGMCHGSSPILWGADTTNFSCTKCHGTPSTVGSNSNMAPAVGAHQAHVKGATAYQYAREYTCYECHNSGTTSTFTNHMNGNNQNVVFDNASTAKDNSVVAAWTAGTYPNGTCNVYCHGVAMPKGDTSGTTKTPSWTTNFMTGVKANDCATCHGNPPSGVNGGDTVTTHLNKAATTSCYECHDHFNNAGGFDNETNRRKHIDGALQAKGDCNACHPYDDSAGTGMLWSGWNTPYSTEGRGAHVKHINYIKARWGVTLTATSDKYETVDGPVTKVCGVCHTINSAEHMVGTRNINFGGSTARQFGSLAAKYNGTVGTASSVDPKSCANIDCHFKTSPVWQ